MNLPRPILVAGIGNIFFGDDAFGCEVVRELLRQRRPWPENVRLEDFGIRSYDLACAIMDGVDTILIDAAPRGHAPGTLYLIEPELDNLRPEPSPGSAPEGHTMSLAGVLKTVESFGGQTGKLYLVGCEPTVLERDDGHFGLSAPVQAAVPDAIALVERVVADLIYHKDPIPINPIRRALAGPLKETR
jgi:hydrogenase maturation protease